MWTFKCSFQNMGKLDIEPSWFMQVQIPLKLYLFWNKWLIFKLLHGNKYQSLIWCRFLFIEKLYFNELFAWIYKLLFFMNCFYFFKKYSNKIGALGCEHLSAAFKTWKNLTSSHLNLREYGFLLNYFYFEINGQILNCFMETNSSFWFDAGFCLLKNYILMSYLLEFIKYYFLWIVLIFLKNIGTILEM